MKIEKIKTDDKRAEVLYLCPNDCFQILESDWLEHRKNLPKSGEEISEEAYSLLLRLDLRAVLMSRALSKMSYGDNTKKELYRKIRSERHRGEIPDGEAAKEVVLFLAKKGLIREGDYCKRLTKSYANKLYGRKKVREALKNKGFSDKMIEKALDELNYDFFASCRELCLRRRGAKSNEDAAKTREYLYRRGFSYEEIKEALENTNEREENSVEREKYVN